MEYIEEGDLSKLIDKYRKEEKSLPEELIWTIFVQILSALKYLHENRIIHRDIKSSNILITSSNVVKLADFGLAKLLPSKNDEFEHINSTQGSLYYLSPEEAGNNPYSYPIDIWSLGVVLYELMTLKLPFYISSSYSKSVYKQIIEDDFEPIDENYSIELREIVSQMLVKEPDERITIEKPRFHQINLEQTFEDDFWSGIKYQFGFGESQDLHKAKKFFQSLLESNDPKVFFGYAQQLMEDKSE
jgi:NIMA (never in mitosis gene a)-related kinase